MLSYSAMRFPTIFHYFNQFGVTATAQTAKFALWAYHAQEVRLNLYHSGEDEEAFAVYSLSRIKGHSWTLTVKENLIGKFYTYQIRHNNRWLAETPDPWAKAVSANGKRGAIVDFERTNPVGWNDDWGPITRCHTDAVVYELHHRDFSAHAHSGIANKGKFIALLENGTKSENGESTGIDHLKQLGVTHVQIMPSFCHDTFGSDYNWGYNPLQYNAPHPAFSTDPSQPHTPILEMKKMVQALHKAGIGVVMDVVYNHTALAHDSCFSLTSPGLFYRMREDGSWSNASGCGNEIASDNELVRAFIVNSLIYWMKEYHIDGFRFDLMAIHDITTMQTIAKMLRDYNPQLLLYGEGWTADDSTLPLRQRAQKTAVKRLKGVAVFSDDIRDALMGGCGNNHETGFAAGQPGLEESVKIGIVGATPHPQVLYSKGIHTKRPYANSAAQVVNYVSCHDDLCLTDRLNITLPNASVSDRQRIARLAQTIVMTSQGMPFIFCGEEIWRDRKGVRNPYNAPDDVNAIDWNLKLENREHFEYYRNLIALRKAHPAFRMTNPDDIARHIKFRNIRQNGVIAYSITDHANGDEWETIHLIFNGNPHPVKVKIPTQDTPLKVIAHNATIHPIPLASTRGGLLTIPPHSATILAH